MRLLFLHAGAEWTGATRVFVTVAHALASRGHETAIVGVRDSDVVRIARRSKAQVLELEPGRSSRRHSRQVEEYCREFHADTVFVHTDAEHAMAASALKGVGRGGLIRRIAAGERFESTRRTRRAEGTWPVRYLYTSESPPTGHASPSGTLTAVRAELGVPVFDTPLDTPVDGYGVMACLASREALRRATSVLRTAAMLAQQHRHMRLRVIGSAAGDPDLHVLASALGLARKVDWITHASSASAALSGVAAGWVVADGDDAGLGLLHLMSHGIVPLAERTPVASRYVTSGVHGVLMARMEPAAMAAETTLLLADRERRLTMAGAGRTRVEREFPLREMLSGFESAARASRDRRTPA